MGKFGDPTTENQVRTAKRINYFALLFLILMLGSIFFFFLQLQNKKAELIEKTEMLADSTDNLSRIRAELEAAQNDLEAREESTLTVLRDVSQLVEEENYGRAREVAQKYDDWEAGQRISLNVYSFGVDERQRRAVDSYLTKSQHHVVLNRKLSDPASWLQDSSTVLFYDSGLSGLASQIATDLQAATGDPFRTKQGNSGDVPQVTDQRWINIHYIEPTRVPRKNKRKGR